MIDRHRQRSIRPGEDAARPRRRSERRLAVLRRRHARCDDRHARARRLAAARRSSPTRSTRSIWSSCCSIAAPIRTSRSSASCTRRRCAAAKRSTPRRSIRAAIAADVEALKLMIAQGRARSSGARPRSKKEGRARRLAAARNANVGKTPIDGGDGRRPRRGVRRRPGLRAARTRRRSARRRTASRSRRSRCCSPPAPIRTPRRRTARRCCIRPSPRGRCRSSARWSPPARSSTRSTRTT